MLGLSSIGEFAIGEYSAAVSHDVPINVTVSNSLQPQIPELRTGVTIGVPAVSMSTEPAAPSISSGALIDIPVSDTVLTPQAPEIRRGTAIAVNTLSLDQFAYAPPILRGGISIFWASDELLPNETGSIGEGSIGEFAIGEGPINYTQVHRIPSLMISPRRPEVASGGAVLPGVFDIDSIPYPNDINARARKLRSQGIAS